MKTRIKYDRQFYRFCKVVTVVTGVILALFMFFMFLPDEVTSHYDINRFMVVFIMAGTMSVPLFPLCIILLIDSTIYLKRLEKNGFSVPEKKKDYGNDLSMVPRTEVVENRYAKDSKTAACMMLAAYPVFLVCDIHYLLKWIGYGENLSAGAMFTYIMIFHLIFPVTAFVFFRQRNTEKYVDEVDIGNGRKTRFSVNGALGLLIIYVLAASFSVMTAHSMTKYVYKSRYGSYDKDLDSFKAGAQLQVNSDDLHDGVWGDIITNTDRGENLSPSLSFEEVEGAKYYVIYMVDESANNWVHWIAEVNETTLERGANKGEYVSSEDFRYIGPYPPANSGEHTYTVYVYALKDRPDGEGEYEFDEPFFGGDILYYDRLNISERGDINTYGNVLKYGYISGVYER